ncbi:hypothetical protein A1O7_02193 [Cladophialophora yegresii CBS 114405]|uniref:Uncharacterized protein n=1 Tax=Cladophialophora yegresii CBS 114405 TaxID=1182544 RepID=W9W1C0_9EURO|nr:uncharacterized protein A1O7_02193 [Cladophialophora yegresii CBS 114405]EXJ61763.1 hypothetical protein A1O7_02193 [Cladophialophora yegresii CBS 114405]
MENRLSTSRPGSEKDHRLSSSPPRSQSSTSKLEPPPPTPAYDASALLIQPSPLMTSSLHSRNSATSAQESAYLRQAGSLWWIRLSLTLVAIATAIAAVGCEAHVLHRYNSTRPGDDSHLPPLWPSNVDVRPALAVLISACIIVATSIVYLVWSLIPTPYSRTLFYNFLFLGTSITGLILTVFTLPFANLLTGFKSHHARESIQSWTCKFSHGASQFMADAHSLQIPVYVPNGVPIPAGFNRLCQESEVGQGLVATLLALKVVSCAVAVVGLIVERNMTKKRNERYAVHGEKAIDMS